ncbi:hypothetical protein EXM22_01790 [Oceanispirochaeta crateris]|uniref:Uncharacterized protein n=1 Tax=Oceanispirochaeta crateris TaxID=2518645 RepID=A0A5C1QF90_9SPIO|nr:hypothetical protein [Oceanispirochaeta crateris]QEN06783.1 hypothetical protein EXM22_01790 [Oceanispirochaeta crateris]
MNKTFIRTCVYILSGIILGYFILHPVSYLIIDFSKGESFGFLEILKKSFAFTHLTMAFYFMLLGGIIGLLFVLYYNLENKVYTEFTDLNIQMDDRSKNILNIIDKDSENLTIFIKQIWPTLNSIHTGISLVISDNDEMTKTRKRDILSITKENISSVFNLIDIMTAYEDNERNK